MAGEEYVFMLTASLSLFAQVVFVFGFVKLTEPGVRKIFRFFFFANLLFSVSQVSILVATIFQGFNYNFFIGINAFFSFFMAVSLMIANKEAELFSNKILSGGNKNGN